MNANSNNNNSTITVSKWLAMPSTMVTIMDNAKSGEKMTLRVHDRQVKEDGTIIDGEKQIVVDRCDPWTITAISEFGKDKGQLQYNLSGLDGAHRATATELWGILAALERTTTILAIRKADMTAMPEPTPTAGKDPDGWLVAVIGDAVCPTIQWNSHITDGQYVDRNVACFHTSIFHAGVDFIDFESELLHGRIVRPARDGWYFITGKLGSIKTVYAMTSDEEVAEHKLSNGRMWMNRQECTHEAYRLLFTGHTIQVKLAWTESDTAKKNDWLVSKARQLVKRSKMTDDAIKAEKNAIVEGINETKKQGIATTIDLTKKGDVEVAAPAVQHIVVNATGEIKDVPTSKTMLKNKIEIRVNTNGHAINHVFTSVEDIAEKLGGHRYQIWTSGKDAKNTKNPELFIPTSVQGITYQDDAHTSALNKLSSYSNRNMQLVG